MRFDFLTKLTDGCPVRVEVEADIDYTEINGVYVTAHGRDYNLIESLKPSVREHLLEEWRDVYQWLRTN